MKIIHKATTKTVDGGFKAENIAVEHNGHGKTIAMSVIGIGTFSYDEKMNTYGNCLESVTISMATRLDKSPAKKICTIYCVNDATDLCSPLQKPEEGVLKKQLRGPMTDDGIEEYLDRFVAAIFYIWERM